ncbi:ABC transporter ATP-binding protein [Lichenicola cladoniae]|uniref:ABC transporter ATP-binding protein n=1 Tax=Lichenicola cladoniae TaxID=1484109 RepID=A0A6M8HL17_9PROT|nr:ABC transporter ATP-binding protein [Lichenicola cladoniae]NPD69634.1 ABC transporter ATP-binding protein [Acetobacteraceae bacterium]QKE88715.1 ABC transporter ATP-binding protein [Lichenicola cladoniae]
MPRLQVDSVSVLAPGRQGGLLREVTLTLLPGQCLALLGTRNAGGSLLLDVIGGTTTPSSGRILLDGLDAGSMTTLERRLGIVSIEHPLFPHLSVRGNIGFPLRVRGMSSGERSGKVDQALALLGLEALADLRTAHLDQAARVRTMIARALVFDPRLLLLTDPFAALEPEPRQALQRMLRRLVRARSLTVLLTTGDREEALLLGDEIGVLDDGSLHQVGTAVTLLDRPADPTVASRMGDANLLTGRVIRVDDEGAMVRLSSGYEMEGEPGEPLQEGAACVLCVRPERIATAFLSRPGLEIGTASLPATLLEAVHLGDHLRLRFRLEDGSEVLVRRPPAALATELRPDRPAMLAWQPHQATVFLAPSA